MALTWPRQRVRMIVTRMHAHTDGGVTAEVQFRRTREGGDDWHLDRTLVNLLSSTTKTSLAKKLDGIADLEEFETSWRVLIEQMSEAALSGLREGEPLQWADTRQPASRVDYLLEPILQRGQPTLIYGPGGTGKSYLAMVMGVIMALPWIKNGLNLYPSINPEQVLYLDWEGTIDTYHRRLHQIKAGAGLGDVRMPYLHCSLPLVQDLDAITRRVMEANAKVVIVDSAGVASNGDINTPAVALELYRGLRALGSDITALLIHHTSKGSAQTPGEQKTPFGSVYFENQARKVYEIRADREAGKGCIEVALFDRKVNDAAKAEPWGISIEFGPGTVQFRRKEVGKMPMLSQGMSITARVEDHLLTVGKANLEELCEELGLTREQVKPVLSRMCASGKVINVQHSYAMATSAEAPPW